MLRGVPWYLLFVKTKNNNSCIFGLSVPATGNPPTGVGIPTRGRESSYLPGPAPRLFSMLAGQESYAYPGSGKLSYP
eukprot:178869-Rhodomonas_salina.1